MPKPAPDPSPDNRPPDGGTPLLPKTSGLAKASAICGIVGLLTSTSPIGAAIGLVGVGLGVAALVAIRRADGFVVGNGLAWIGLALGAIATVPSAVGLFAVLGD